MKQLFLYMSLCLIASAQMQEIDIFPPSYKPSDVSGIRILDTKVLSFKPMDKIEFTEISALAYHQEKGLYALSDKGNLFSLELEIESEKIKKLIMLEALPLRTKKGNPLKKKNRDSEGLFLSEDGLIVSFERNPKVSLYDFKGKKIQNYTLAEPLQDITNYQTKNKALEALAEHPEFGVITAPEMPLIGEDEGIHTLYSLNKRWRFKGSGGITSIELMPDNNMLVLERDYHLLWGHTITLKKVAIMQCETGLCPTVTLASLKSTQGWRLDNFEGMTHIKDNIYLMISDDNGSFFQKCIMVLFELKEGVNRYNTQND